MGHPVGSLRLVDVYNGKFMGTLYERGCTQVG